MTVFTLFLTSRCILLIDYELFLSVYKDRTEGHSYVIANYNSAFYANANLLNNNFGLSFVQCSL